MSFPNYSDPLVANWSTGQDSITLTPSIFDSAVIGAYTNNQLARNLVIRASLKMSMTELGEARAVLEYWYLERRLEDQARDSRSSQSTLLNRENIKYVFSN